MRVPKLLVALAAAACTVAAVPVVTAWQAPPARPAAAGAPAADTIALLRRRVKHVFVIYQENRSFDSYFGTFPGAEGLYSHPAAQTPGFEQPIVNVDGTTATIGPFRIGPKEYAADTDDVDHSHSLIDAKMNVQNGTAHMDRFALTEERKYAKTGNPSLMAKQMGELTMAHEDCDTVPFLWLYAKRFVLFDHIFQLVTGPSTPGNLSIIGAQTGDSQAVLDPARRVQGNGDTGAGVPVLNDDDPYWGSPSDTTANKMPANPHDFPGYGIQDNLTYPTLPLTLAGRDLPAVAARDTDRDGDYHDIADDVPALGSAAYGAVPWGWFEEGYGREPTDGADPVDAQGNHASYVTHHNGPQYFGYVANNDAMRAHLHGLQDLWTALASRSLPPSGVFYVKGGYKNIMGLTPAAPDAKVQKNFLGDDDHPAYSDAQISEALVAETINRIVRSPYWNDSAIVITWDDSEGDYDHVPPPARESLPGVGQVQDGPRVPLIVISPFARSGAIVHGTGDHASVVKFVDAIFGLRTLASLPDQQRARTLAGQQFGTSDVGARDGDATIDNLVSAFDVARLRGTAAPLPASLATIPDAVVHTLPQRSGYGCRAIGIVPTDVRMGIPNPIPADFNPRPKTNPSS